MTNISADQENKPEGEFISTLISPEGYASQVNQVATVWSDQLRYIRRKELALQPFGVEMIPMSAVKRITYRQELAIAPFVLGALCLVIVALVFLSPIPGGTRVPIGALALVGFAGYTWTRGIKRHRLDFILAERTLKWRSKAGDFSVYATSVRKIVAFASEAGLLSQASQKPG
jgi:hypothetical protein